MDKRELDTEIVAKLWPKKTIEKDHLFPIDFNFERDVCKSVDAFGSSVYSLFSGSVIFGWFIGNTNLSNAVSTSLYTSMFGT